MRVLLVAKQKKNVDTFETTIAALLASGHEVVLAIQQRDPDRDRKLAERLAHPGFSLVACPEERADAWRRRAPLVRSARDWAQYFQPAYAQARKLHQRALDRLLRELGLPADLDAGAFTLPPATGARLRETLAAIEDHIPSDTLHEEFIARHNPDVVMVTPGLHFGSGQSDVMKSARALGIPVWMLLFSWDNLSTKGALHVAPDRMFVWNERQVREAVDLHGFPADRVTVVGAPRFDEFFALTPAVTRDAFFGPLELDPARKTILYLCSSKFIAADEPAFIRTWLAALRSSPSPVVRACNVVVRPHPDVPFEPADGEPAAITWRGMPQATGWVHRPFGDDQALVLRTTYSTPQAFYECLHHADAVVALNTSAELEAGIAGKPVLTVLSTEAAADGQANTLHFSYLLDSEGGFVTFSPDLPTHLERLTQVLEAPPAEERIQSFVLDFLRPGGPEPVAPKLAAILASTPRDATAPAPDASAQPDVTAPTLAEPAPVAALATKSLGAGDADGPRVLATPETRRSRERGVLRLDPIVTAWLDEALGPGDVLYDVGAGIGAYTLVAAMRRGALVVAFEPGFAVYRTLCENVRQNDAMGQVIALPIALSDQAGLFELEFSGPPGGDQHVLRNREWRQRRESVGTQYGQPVCAERLDAIAARYQVPHPHALRVNARREAARVLAGARDLLSGDTLASVLVTVSRPTEADTAIKVLTDAGFAGSAPSGSDEHGYSMRFDRQRSTRTTSVWDRLRKGVEGRRP